MESGLGELLERVAIKVKNKGKIFFSVPKNLGEYSGRVTWENNLGEWYRKKALDYFRHYLKCTL